ncbi:MAG: TetR/AcrR family transcriptional regulator, partial [Moorea sp. SIO2B7]|nr:TetR/AcrR family transcriptional regulator [Moorena sp. SIO2B7]
DLFYRFIDRIVADKQRRGCLLTNTAVEICPHDSDTANRITTNLQRMEKAFTSALERAKQKGELTSSDEVHTLASYLTCSLQGLLVIAKVNPSPSSLEEIVKIIVSVLD